mmetsp:Transcript_15139/g.43048  ORF Transcript_15139/g.43048 Transcript_15139/m.43048 type:complete len:671 (-) Transcript_15139:57-2069(-)
MRAGRLREQQTHGVALVSERRLHADEDVAKLPSVDKELLTVGVELSGWGSPVLLEGLGVRAEPLVLLDGHLVGDVEVIGVEPLLLIVEDRHDQLLLAGGEVTDVVSILLQVRQHLEDGSEHVQVRSGSDITLVRREREDGDGQLLLGILLLGKRGPLDGPGAEGVDAIRQRVRLSSVGVASGEDDRLNGTIKLRKRNLQGDLNRVDTELAVQPLLGGLEHERQRAHVRHVELLERLDSLGRILTGGTADQGESSQGQDGVDVRPSSSQRVVEVLLDRQREVERTGEHRDDLGTTGLELGHDTGVMALVSGHQMRPLEHQSDHRGVLLELDVGPRVVPVQVLLQILVEGRRRRVPDADIREQLRLGRAEVHVLERGRVGLHGGQDKVLQVVHVSAQPVLQRVDKLPGILRLIGRQVLEHLGQGPDQLEQALLKVVVVLAGTLDEIPDDALALPELSHREGSKLVQLHHRRHRREDQARVEGVTSRRHSLDNFIGQLLNEDERPDKDVGRRHIVLKRLEVAGVTQLLQQVAHDLHTKLPPGVVNPVHRSRQRGLVLRLEHDIHDLHLGTTVCLGHDAAGLRVHAGEPTAHHPLANVNLQRLVASAHPSAKGGGTRARRHHTRHIPLRVGLVRHTLRVRMSPQTRPLPCKGSSRQHPGMSETRREFVEAAVLS